MNASFPKAHDIFAEALKLLPADWPQFLDRACGDDAALRKRLENLLAAHREAGTLPPPGDDVAATHDPIIECVGAQIGRYKLLQQIGEGGFGVVYMAEQQQPVRRKVALKIIKPGMDTREIIARFESERQALALMEHPHIDKVS